MNWSLRKENKEMNITHSITSVSTVENSEDDNIVNIFSVTPKTISKRANSSDQRTISEISDDIFLVRPESKSSISNNCLKKNYKEKISEHLKKIRERAATSSALARSRIPIESVRRESEHLDVEINLLRGRFNDREYAGDDFFKFEEPSKQEESMASGNVVYYALPEKLYFTMYLAEKESFLSIKRRWVDAKSDLNLVENPVTPISLRPSRYSLNNLDIIKYVPSSTDTNVQLTEILAVEERILDVYLSHLKFDHHPLFSAENIFAEKLKTAFKEYTSVQESNMLQQLNKNLEDLRCKRYENGDFVNLTKEIKKARNRYFKESKRFKEAVLTILESWKHIKKIRLYQNYSNTSLKLIIKKEKTDVAAEKEEYQNMFENSLTELKNEYDTEKNVQSEDSIDEKKEIKTARGSGDGIGVTSTTTSEDQTEKDLLEHQLKKTMRMCLKTPGEPKLLFALTFTNEVTENPDFTKEVSRRNIIQSTKFYLQIVCNNIEACKTKLISLSEDFTLEIEEIFSLQMTDIPNFLTIEVYEQPKSLMKRKLCEIYLDVTSVKIPMQRLRSNFEKTDIVHYKHEGVGSGEDLVYISNAYDIKLTNIKNYKLRTCGYLDYGLEWENLQTKKYDRSFNTEIQDLDGIIDQNFVIDHGQLNKLIETVNTNKDGICQTDEFQFERDKSKYFRLSLRNNMFAFCHISVIEENIRLKILRLRDRKEVEFDGILVPNRLKEIPVNVFSYYLRRKDGEEGRSNFDDKEDLQENYCYGKKYLQRVHLNIFHLCKNTENNLDYDSVLNEKFIIYFHFMIKNLVHNFFNWFRWRPKLNKPLPILRTIEAEDSSQILKTNLNLVVKVLNAKNIPRRKKDTFNDYEKSENEVCPFVEVTYKNIFARTTTSRSSNPIWNEEIIIPLESSHMDYLNPNSLEGIITVNLFDESETIVKKLNKNCNNWLGGIDILLSAVCCLDKMNGLFQIKIPYMLLDYEGPMDKILIKSPKIPTAQTTRTYLQMELSIVPTIPKLSPNMEEFLCSDLPYIQEHVLKWNRYFNESFPQRKFNALVLDITGKATCVTHFIKPIEPPQINTEEFDVTVEQCCRYISLIPFTVSNHFYNNIWLSTDQLIRFMLGSLIDHVIALTCYLKALKLDVFLLLGYGIPHGNTAYVFFSEYSPDASLPLYYIIDVVYNEKYNIMEDDCPLQKIHCIMNEENVWANTQKTDKIMFTRFDFNRSSDWLPLFDNNTPAPMNLIGTKVTYMNKGGTEILEMKLEKQLKRQISKLRLLDKTTWNSRLSNVLANLLKTSEINCMYNKSQYDILMELKVGLSSYKVKGFVINTPFTSLSNLVNKIKRLNIHVQQEQDTEFSLAVYIHSYPGRVLSVWISLISLVNSV